MSFCFTSFTSLVKSVCVFLCIYSVFLVVSCTFSRKMVSLTNEFGHDMAAMFPNKEVAALDCYLFVK